MDEEDPSSSRTITPENSNDVLARVAHIVSTFIQVVSKFLSDYFDLGEKYYNEEMEGKGILRRIFFSPLTRKKAFIISCIAVSIDPLFFYIPVIDEKNKCLGIDKRLKTAALCLRALPDAAFALPAILSLFGRFKGALKDVDSVFEFFEPVVGLFLAVFLNILIGAFLFLLIPQGADR